MNDLAIRVNHVSKTFKLPHEKQNSMKSLFVNAFRSKKTYEVQQALNDVSFEIKKGEFFGIVGRNGSGKSTLLKLLAGIYEPNKGSIQVNGRLTPFIELGVGFNPNLTGRENLFLNGALLGFNRKEMSDMYQEIVDFAEIEKFMDQKLKNYSSGMQIRLAFSIAIRANTDILLIDEVLAVGDQSFQEKCYKYFSSVKKTDKTVIFVTHDMGSVERFCDRVMLLDKSYNENGIYNVREAVTRYNRLNHPQKNTDETEAGNNKHREKSEIYIKNVLFIDKKGKNATTFKQGDKFTMRIQFHADKSLPAGKKIVLGLAFYDNDNVNLAGPNSSMENFTTDKNIIDYVIPRMPFNMGEYHVTVALFDEYAAEQYDFIDKGYSFFVNTDEARHGKIILDGIWQAL